MLTAPGWHDYALLDAAGGERHERWGEVTVIRPDPQAFWPRTRDWPRPDMHYHRSTTGGGHWEKFKPIPDKWTISWENLRLTVKPTGFKHMGLFPEQAVNWKWLHDKIVGVQSAKVLNLFAYTGAATVACLAAGANVTHIDAAKGMNAQAKQNVILSGLEARPHRILADDVLKFVQREKRRGNTYDGIILDPPVYGRGPTGEMWRLEDNLYDLLRACTQILSPTPLFILLNAYTAGFSPHAYGNVLQAAAPAGTVSVSEIGLQATSGIVLPCGSFARWLPN